MSAYRENAKDTPRLVAQGPFVRFDQRWIRAIEVTNLYEYSGGEGIQVYLRNGRAAGLEVSAEEFYTAYIQALTWEIGLGHDKDRSSI